MALKSTLGRGYSVQVTFDAKESSVEEWFGPPAELIDRIRVLAPQAYMSEASQNLASYHLETKDSVVVERILQLLDDHGSSFRVASYDVLGASIEDVFLTLMHQERKSDEVGNNNDYQASSLSDQAYLKLADSRPMSPFSQALTIFYKRTLIARRSWLAPFLLVLVAVAGSSVPLFFLSGRSETCKTIFSEATSTPLYLPSFLLDLGLQTSIIASPPGVARTLGEASSTLSTIDVADNSSFINAISQNYRNLALGGISLDLSSGRSLVAWEASPPGLNGPVMLNFATNILYNHAINSSGIALSFTALISARYESFPVSTLLSESS